MVIIEILTFPRVQIPSLIRDCLDHTSTPLDGITLTEAMHQRGINMRYLGKLAQRLVKIPQLDYFLTIVLSEILVRSAKHVFQTFLQVCAHGPRSGLFGPLRESLFFFVAQE